MTGATHRDTDSPEELAAYSSTRAGQICRLSPSTVRFWACGDGEHAPIFVPAETTPLTLSFNNLVEVFVLASIRRAHDISMQKVRKALKHIAGELGIDRPLINARFRTDGVKLFIEEADTFRLVSSRDQQMVLKGFLDQSLKRIEWGKSVAQRLYPWVRADITLDQPHSIVIDPRRGFGQPVIAGTGIQARIVAERYRAGESIAALAKDYKMESEQIEDAIRCETREAA